MAPSVAGSGSVMPNVTNSVSSVSGTVGVGGGVSSVASQNSVSNGSTSSTSVCFCFIYICSETWILYALNLHFPLFCVCLYQSCHNFHEKDVISPQICVCAPFCLPTS